MRYFLYIMAAIWCNQVAYSQTYFGLGITYDHAQVSQHETWNNLVIGNGFTYHQDSSQVLVPTFTLEHFLTHRLSVIFDFQLIGSRRFEQKNGGFIYTYDRYKVNYYRGALAVRYHPHDNWFLGVGPTLQYDGKAEYHISFNLESPFNEGPQTTNLGIRNFGMQLQTGVFFKGFELQLAYLFKPFHKDRQREFLDHSQGHLLRSQLSPTLRYTLNLSKTDKRRKR